MTWTRGGKGANSFICQIEFYAPLTEIKTFSFILKYGIQRNETKHLYNVIK
jgi:hypothetical protein